MTTLVLSEIFPPRTGGSGRWLWELYRRMPREDYLIAAGEHSRQAEFDQTQDLRIVRLPLALPAWGLRSFRGLRGYGKALASLRPIIRSEHINMLHCGRCLPEGVMALALKWWANLPYICYVHGEDVATAASSRELTWLVRRVLRGSQLLIANSRSTQRMLCQDWGMPEDGVAVLNPGVDTLRWVPASPDRAFRTRLGWEDRFVILTVGRLQERKGHDHMIRAMQQVRERCPRALYAIVGDGEELPRLRALSADRGLDGNVQFLGERDDSDLLRCYQQCDLFVLPNRQVGRDIEGFGMVLLEAQACGKPVLAGDSGGTAETMRVGESGRIVDCRDPEALARCVVDMLGNHARLWRMGQAGREWVVERFDWEILSRKASQLFPRPRPSARQHATMEAIGL